MIFKIETLTNRGWGVGRIILSSQHLLKEQKQQLKQQNKRSRNNNPDYNRIK